MNMGYQIDSTNCKLCYLGEYKNKKVCQNIENFLTTKRFDESMPHSSKASSLGFSFLYILTRTYQF